MEEYSIAKQIWHFTSVDLCEIARNSVLQSGFPESDKEHWLGSKNYRADNVTTKTNVPPLRASFRRQQMSHELRLLEGSTTMAEMDSSIAEMLLLSPKGGRTASSSSAFAMGCGDDGDREEQLPPERVRGLLSPLPEDGVGVTDSDLLGADGEEKEGWRSPILAPLPPLSPVWPNGAPEDVFAKELENLRCILPEAGVRKSCATPRSPDEAEDVQSEKRLKSGGTHGTNR